jgi:uncharacterized protein YggE
MIKGMKHVTAMLLLIGLPVAAGAETPTQAPSQPPPVITATGHGIANAVVTTALVRVVAGGVADESGLVEAIRAAGVENPVAERGRPRPDGVALLGIRGRVSDATHARLDAVAAAVTRYGKTHSGTSIVDIRFYGTAADCPAIEQRAREAALADARRRARAIAETNSTPLGAQLAVAETGGCPRVGPSGGAFAIDVATMSMRVVVEQTVTFATMK